MGEHVPVIYELSPSPPLVSGVSNLIQQVCRLNKGLRLLNLSKTSLSSKGKSAPLRCSSL